MHKTPITSLSSLLQPILMGESVNAATVACLPHHFKGLLPTPKHWRRCLPIRHSRFQILKLCRHNTRKTGTTTACSSIRQWRYRTKPTQSSCWNIHPDINWWKRDVHDPITYEQRHNHKMFLKSLLHAFLRDQPLASTISFNI